MLKDGVLVREYAALLELTHRISQCESKGIEMMLDMEEASSSRLRFCTYDLSTIDLTFHTNPGPYDRSFLFRNNCEPVYCRY